MEGYYYCRHCGSNVGSVTAEKVYSDVLFQLTEQEVVEMIHFHENGNIYIKTICELCQETLTILS